MIVFEWMKNNNRIPLELDGKYYWFKEYEDGNNTDLELLPLNLYELMEGKEKFYGCRIYSSKEEAINALQEALNKINS